MFTSRKQVARKEGASHAWINDRDKGGEGGKLVFLFFHLLPSLNAFALLKPSLLCSQSFSFLQQFTYGFMVNSITRKFLHVLMCAFDILSEQATTLTLLSNSLSLLADNTEQQFCQFLLNFPTHPNKQDTALLVEF